MIPDSSIQTRPCPACSAPDLSPAGEILGWPLACCRQFGLSYSLRVPSAGELSAIYAQLYSDGDLYRRHLDAVSTPA